ncbi:YdcA family protein [Thiopseudomonas alkaliphila]|uniref:hypothetical protein n=1 Tax=Thiopseudomonas alkaliphila TaxID=1697053 RepID=UPI0009BB969B|nr:hypothetical protein [Thiopseudomonas alkaliphila]
MFQAFGLLTLSITTQAIAANFPCSGAKGGISHCNGATFVCNDGSISGSKRNCSAVFTGSNSTTNTINRAYSAAKANSGSSNCACGTGNFCTGPRGGVYCITPSGNKSYRRK